MRLDVAIQATVVLELLGVDDAPGVKEGGVLEQVTRELTIEALPTEIPDSLEHHVAEMEIGDTITLDALTAPPGVKLVDDPETVIATLSPPRLQLEEEPEIEEETELVAEGESRRGRGRRRPRAATAATPTAPAVQYRARSCTFRRAVAGSSRRLADRRARQPRQRVRGHPPQHRLRGRRTCSRRAGSCPSPSPATAGC